MARYLKIVVGVLLPVVAGYYAWRLFSHPGTESPEKLARAALEAPTPLERETAAVRLAQLGKAAREHLARTLAQSKQPAVRVACVRGLGQQWSYGNMPALLDALDDESPAVRAQAGIVVERLLMVHRGFHADDAKEKRDEVSRELRDYWEEFQQSPSLMAVAGQQVKEEKTEEKP